MLLVLILFSPEEFFKYFILKEHYVDLLFFFKL